MSHISSGGLIIPVLWCDLIRVCCVLFLSRGYFLIFTTGVYTVQASDRTIPMMFLGHSCTRPRSPSVNGIDDHSKWEGRGAYFAEHQRNQYLVLTLTQERRLKICK